MELARKEVILAKSRAFRLQTPKWKSNLVASCAWSIATPKYSIFKK
jgi:hypothetical protein